MLGIAAAGGALCAATLLAVALLDDGGGGPAGPGESPTPDASPTAPPAPTATPLPGGARDLTYAGEVEFPPDTSIIVGLVTDHGNGGILRVIRMVRLGDAGVVVDELAAGIPEGSKITSLVSNEDGSVLWMARCDGADCVLEGGPKEEVTTSMLRSGVCGIRWEEVGRLEGEWWMRFVGERRDEVAGPSAPMKDLSLKIMRPGQQPALP